MCRAKERTPKAEHECNFVWVSMTLYLHFCFDFPHFSGTALDIFGHFGSFSAHPELALATSRSGHNAFTKKSPSQTVFGLIVVLKSLWRRGNPFRRWPNKTMKKVKFFFFVDRVYKSK